MGEDNETSGDTETTVSEESGRIVDTASDEPVEVGDFREKHVRIVTADGEEIDHSSVYLKHSATAFIVSQDPEFPPGATERYEKDEIANVQITQHHSACFITTATTADDPTLDRLRGFRDDTLRTNPIGRCCLGLYYTVSPPIAETLRRHPRSRLTRIVRWLVRRCGEVAARRTACRVRFLRAGYSICLVGLYVIGLLVAAIGHLLVLLHEQDQPLR